MSKLRENISAQHIANQIGQQHYFNRVTPKPFIGFKQTQCRWKDRIVGYSSYFMEILKFYINYSQKLIG